MRLRSLSVKEISRTSIGAVYSSSRNSPQRLPQQAMYDHSSRGRAGLSSPLLHPHLPHSLCILAFSRISRILPFLESGFLSMFCRLSLHLFVVVLYCISLPLVPFVVARILLPFLCLWTYIHHPLFVLS